MSPKIGAVAVALAFFGGAAALIYLSFPRFPVSDPVTVRGGENERPLESAISDFDPEQIVTVLPFDAIRALSDPPLVPAQGSNIEPDELVIGVEFEGEARAYPVTLLSVHEIVNDEIEGRPFAVTWCPLCHTGVVYDREVDGQILTLGVSGKLYRNSLMMFDRETRTLWSHFLGAGVEGPLAGKRLRFIPSTFATLEEWRTEHPDSLVVDAGPYVPYGDDPYETYFSSPAAGILGTKKRDERLPPKVLVLGVLQPAAKAYAFEDVQRLGRIEDTLAGEAVEIVWNPVSQQASAFRVLEDGREPLPATPVYWFAWVDFFPGAPLWDPPDRPRGKGAPTTGGWPSAPMRPSAPVREQ